MTGGYVNPRAAIALYFAAIFLGGCLIAPWIHHLMQALASPLPFLKGLADEPFRRYVTRSWMIIGALTLWPFLKCLGANSLKGVGLRRGQRFGRELGIGFAIGFGSLAIIAALALLYGAREFNFGHEPARYFKHMLNAVLAALLVPIIEEVFFRGAIFGGMRKDQRLLSAALGSSAIYAIVHFFQRSIWTGPVTWSSGLELLPRMLSGFGDIQQLIPGFFSLTLAGMMLALAYHRTGSLYLSMGLHGGWIFWLKSYGFLTLPIQGANARFWGTNKLIDGWLAFALLTFMFIGFWRWSQPPSSTDNSSDESPNDN
jgi:membrane protease YdiL (CAAX protease family)